MGREGEVVAELLPEFERTHPGIRVEVQQIPWTAAHEKLLTAFAGDATPDLCPAGQHLDSRSSPACRRSRRSTSGVTALAGRRAGRLFPRHLGHQRRRRQLYGVPWYVDTRLLFYRTRPAGAGRLRRARRAPGSEWQQMLAAIKARAGPERYAILLPLNEFEQLLVLALQQDEPLLRDGGPLRRLPTARAFGARSASTSSIFPAVGAAGRCPTPRYPNVWNEFGPRLLLLLHHRPVEHRRVPPPAAAPSCRAAGRRRRCRVPTDQAYRSPAARAWCCSRPRAKRGAWRCDRVPVSRRRSSGGSTS